MRRRGSPSRSLFDRSHHLLRRVGEVLGRKNRQSGLLQDPLAEIDVGAFEANDERDVQIDLARRGNAPSAMTSQRMIPPKMLTRIPSTLGSLRISLNAVDTRSFVAPPPTSRKFAGFPPCNLMMSIVAIARPAPLTMQPILPSSLM